MSSNAAAAHSAKPLTRQEIIVDFDPVKLHAPFFLRCGAIAVDYLLFIIIPVLGLIFGRMLGEDGAKLIHSDINNIAWLASILVSVCNVVLLPMVSGQSVGKMITGIRIVNLKGGSASVGSIIFRDTFGYLLTLASLGIGFLLSVFSSKGRALHDYVSGTVVVYANSRTRS